MERRFLIAGISFAIGIIAIILFFFFRTGKSGEINLFNVVPQDAAIIIKLNSPGLAEKLVKKEFKIWNEALQLPLAADLNAKIQIFDSLVKAIPQINDHLKRNPAIISGHFSGANTINFLLIVPLPETIKNRHLQTIIQDFEKKEGFSISERKFEGAKIIGLSKSSQTSYYLAQKSNFLLFSYSSILIENALRQSTLKETLANDILFSEIVKTTGKNKDANIYIDLRQAGKFMAISAQSLLHKQLTKNTSFGSWTELDINVKDNLLLFNGFTLNDTTELNFIRSISSGKPIETEVHKVLPASVSCFFSFGLSNPEESYIAYLEYLKKINKYNAYTTNLQNLTTKYDIDFARFFLDLTDNELTLAYKASSDKVSESYMLLIKCKSGTEAEKSLAELTQKLEGKFNDKLYTVYSPDNELRKTIYRIPIYPLFGKLIGDFFNVFDENYLFVVDNYLVVVNSFSQASEFLNENMLQKTLVNDELYQQFASNLSPKSFMLSYINLAKSQSFFSRYFNKEFQKQWDNNVKAFEKNQTMGLQLSAVSNQPYFTVFLNYLEEYKGKPRTVWESLLDTTLNFKPKFVVNHISNQNEIVLQDTKNNFYLLNQSGRIIWKTPLSEPINSDIYQIDYFKNGKLQYLFSTTTQIHLIDRNGNYVERYPIKLRAEATAGISVFDYDKNKNYRLIIPCSDKNVYAFSKEGTLLSDWKFKGSDHLIKQPVNHFKVGDKDFIVFGDGNYTYITDRRGSERVRITESFEKSSRNNYFLYDAGNLDKSFFLTTSSSGEIVKIFYSGSILKQQIRDLSENHYFDFKDVNADGKPDYIFLDNNTLSSYTLEGKLIFEKKFEEIIDLPPVYYQFSHSDRKIGLVSSSSQKIMLVNNTGEMYKGFPLEGTTMFSVGYFDLTSNRFNLIVGGRNNFLYNYTVE